MKACKRWTTSGPSVCTLCRSEQPVESRGVLCDIAGPIEMTTIIKFVCISCAADIANVVAGEEICKRSAEENARARQS